MLEVGGSEGKLTPLGSVRIRRILTEMTVTVTRLLRRPKHSPHSIVPGRGAHVWGRMSHQPQGPDRHRLRPAAARRCAWLPALSVAVTDLEGTAAWCTPIPLVAQSRQPALSRRYPFV
jgi:hypothetical protein